MCEFFSCVSNGQGAIWYFDWELRKRCISGELDYSPDSHTSIADYYGFGGEKEDHMNKYEFNPLTGYFDIEQLNGMDDSQLVEVKVRQLDFSKIVPQLVIKEIVDPFGLPLREVTPEMIKLLENWNSVRNSVWDSVWNSVWNSVRNSMRNSVWDSVRNSVWNSVWDSVWAYAVSFFSGVTNWEYTENLGPNPWEPCQKLWGMGIVPSFDGKIWRLHSGPKADIIYTWEPNK